MARRALVLCTSCEIGGMERLAAGITRQLVARGWAAELVFAKGQKEADVVAWAACQGVHASADPAVVSVMESARPWSSVVALARFIRSRRPDVVNFHYGGAHISLKDVLAARIACARRVVAEVHLPVAWEAAGRRKRMMTRLAGHLSSAVVVHSQAVRDVVLAAGVPAAKVRLVSPGLEAPVAPIKREDARDGMGLPPGAFIVGCAARLVRHKGVEDLVRAFAEVRGDAVLVVAGDGPERQRLEWLAAELLPGKIRFLGALTGDMSPFFAALDLFVLPSHREGFGLVLVEAALRGVPVVGTRIGGIEDAVRDGETGILVPMGEIPELSAAINRLADDPELRRRLAMAGLQRALAEFTEDSMGDAMERVLAPRGCAPAAAVVTSPRQAR